MSGLSPLVVPEVSGHRAADAIRRLADVINAITRLKAAMSGASDHIVVSKNFADAGAAIAAWAERRRMLEELDQDIRVLALALQERADR